ncbi:MAG: fibronectin type III domain-containing protein, partial [Clostridiales bacterium]|nr:fibronectin type III domain-containing protein [Clostridiales bacterium]
MENKETKHSIAAALAVLLVGSAALQGLGWAAEGIETSDRLETVNLSQTTVEGYEDYIEEYDASAPEDDPLYVRMMDNGVLEEASADVDAVAASLDATLDTLTTVSPYTGKTYTHESRFSDSVVLLGIDVSHWQTEIDWEAVAADGVTFAFIRCGYTGTTNPFRMVEDTYFQENIQGAYDAGIAVGIYYFSQALTVEEAEQEAAWTLSLLEPYQDMITLPVVYDLEKVSGSRTKGLSAAKTTANALAWLEAVKSAGYTAYYYGSTGVLGDLYDLTQLTEYDCWVARYNTATRSDLSYDFWQYANVGSVDGISTAVDCDFYYMDGIGTMGAVTVTEGSGSLTLSWPAVEGATHYQIYRSTASDSGFAKVQTVPASQLSYADTGLAAGTTYYYKVRAYSNAGYLPAYSGFSPSVSGTVPGGTKDSTSTEDSNTEEEPGSTDDADSAEDSSNNLSTETAVTTAPLSLRSGAGTGY